MLLHMPATMPCAAAVRSLPCFCEDFWSAEGGGRRSSQNVGVGRVEGGSGPA